MFTNSAIIKSGINPIKSHFSGLDHHFPMLRRWFITAQPRAPPDIPHRPRSPIAQGAIVGVQVQGLCAW